MKKTGWIVGVVALCAMSFMAGTHQQAPVVRSVAADSAEVAPEPDWRNEVRMARASADAGTARGRALALLDEATGDVALVRAVQLLAPVATDPDVPILESIARSGDPRLASPSMGALALIGSEPAVQILLDLAEKPASRGLALRALGTSGHPRAFRYLKASLDDPLVQPYAAEGLVALGTPEAAAELIARFDDAIDWQAGSWAENLAAMPAEREEARQALLEAARSGPEIRREAAMGALARHRDPGIYPLLATKAALGDGPAIRALGQLDDARAVDLLGDLVARGGAPASNAIDALASMRNPRAAALLLEAVEGINETVAVQAVYLMQNLGDPHVLSTFLWAAAEARQSVAQAAASRLMQHSWGRSIPPEVLDLARQRLDAYDPDPGSCIAVLLRYGTRADHSSVHTLVLDGPQQLRLAAVWTLQSLHTTESADLLVRLVEDPDPYVSSQALAAAVARGGLEGRVEAVLLAQLDEDPGALQNIGSYLVQIDSVAGLRRLEELAVDGDPTEQSIAVNALMASANPEITGRLIVSAKHLPPELQSQIYSAALYNSAVDPTDLADRVIAYGDPSIQYVAVEALANSGTPRAAKRLLSMSYDVETRDAALNGLARIGGPEAEERLLSAATDPATAGSALMGLQTLGTPTARDAIADIARSGPDGARLSALFALQGMPGPRSQDTFIDAAFDADESIRRAAIDGLAAAGTREAGDVLGALLDGDDAQAAAYGLQRMGGRVYRDHREQIDALVNAPFLDDADILDPWSLPVDIHGEMDFYPE